MYDDDDFQAHAVATGVQVVPARSFPTYHNWTADSGWQFMHLAKCAGTCRYAASRFRGGVGCEEAIDSALLAPHTHLSLFVYTILYTVAC